MQRTHKTLSLFILLLFALTSIGSAQSSKRFEGHSGEFSIQASSNYQSTLTPQDAREGIELNLEDRRGEVNFILITEKVPTPAGGSSAYARLLDEGVFSADLPAGLKLRPVGKDISFQLAQGKMILRETIASFQESHGTTDVAHFYVGLFVFEHHLYYFTAVAPLNDQRAKSQLLGELQTFRLTK